jgi:hypothetical protein
MPNLKNQTMKYSGFLIVILVMIFFSYNHENQSKASIGINSLQNSSTKDSADKDEIQNLIRQMLNWANSKKSIDVLPVLSKDSICTGFDFDKHKLNLEKLKETNLFADEFIENYNQIILTLDRKIKSKELEKWNIYELPTFSFSNDIDPWCLCQDVPYDNPNPWDLVEVRIINLNSEKGNLYWKWGKLELNNGKGWKEFTYRFKVVKESSKWKISYLEGFELNNGIR